MTSPSIIPLSLCIESIQFHPSMGISHWMKKVQFEWYAVSSLVNNKRMVKGTFRRGDSVVVVGTFVSTDSHDSRQVLGNRRQGRKQRWQEITLFSLKILLLLGFCQTKDGDTVWLTMVMKELVSRRNKLTWTTSFEDEEGMNHEWVRSLVPEKRLSNETMMMSCFFLFLIPLALREKSILYSMTYVVDSAMVSPSINVLPLSMTTGREGGGEKRVTNKRLIRKRKSEAGRAAAAYTFQQMRKSNITRTRCKEWGEQWEEQWEEDAEDSLTRDWRPKSSEGKEHWTQSIWSKV